MFLILSTFRFSNFECFHHPSTQRGSCLIVQRMNSAASHQGNKAERRHLVLRPSTDCLPVINDKAPSRPHQFNPPRFKDPSKSPPRIRRIHTTNNNSNNSNNHHHPRNGAPSHQYRASHNGQKGDNSDQNMRTNQFHSIQNKRHYPSNAAHQQYQQHQQRQVPLHGMAHITKTNKVIHPQRQNNGGNQITRQPKGQYRVNDENCNRNSNQHRMGYGQQLNQHRSTKMIKSHQQNVNGLHAQRAYQRPNNRHNAHNQRNQWNQNGMNMNHRTHQRTGRNIQRNQQMHRVPNTMWTNKSNNANPSSSIKDCKMNGVSSYSRPNAIASIPSNGMVRNNPLHPPCSRNKQNNNTNNSTSNQFQRQIAPKQHSNPPNHSSHPRNAVNVPVTLQHSKGRTNAMNGINHKNANKTNNVNDSRNIPLCLQRPTIQIQSIRLPQSKADQPIPSERMNRNNQSNRTTNNVRKQFQHNPPNNLPINTVNVAKGPSNDLKQPSNAPNHPNSSRNVPLCPQRPVIQCNTVQNTAVQPMALQSTNQKNQNKAANSGSRAFSGTVPETDSIHSNSVCQSKKQVIPQNMHSLSCNTAQKEKVQSVKPNNISKSTATMEEMQKLAYWGLPSDLVAGYGEKGITALYEWQVQCMNNQEVLRGGNLVYSAPTGGGKTLVAEVLMLRNILRTKRKAVFVLPFVSIVVEKVRYFTKIFKRAKIKVKGFYSNKGGAGGLGRNCDIAICTIEKVRNSLLYMQYVTVSMSCCLCHVVYVTLTIS